MNLLDMQSPECVARQLLCCLPSFPPALCSRSVHPSMEKAADPPGIFEIPPGWQRGRTIRRTIQSDTLLSRLWSIDRVRGCLGFFFLYGFFELVKVLRAFYKASRENEGSWSLPKRAVLHIWPSVMITVVGTEV